MAWGKVNVDKQKKLLVRDYKSGKYKVTELCSRYNISRPTAYLWINRHKVEGDEGLKERSRAPKNQPTKTPAEKEEQILNAKLDYLYWGADKIKPYLEKEYPEEKWPSGTCIHNILKRNGLVRSKKIRRKVSPRTTELASSNKSNDIWCVDFKGWFVTEDGYKCEPLTITDDFSRYLIRCILLPRNNTDHVWDVFNRAFYEYGLPLFIRSDNGAPFGSTGVGRLCRLSINLIKAGVTPEWIAPGKPQENGRHERMHRSLKAETASPPARTLNEQVQRFAEFQEYYNYTRPHGGINNNTPGEIYEPSKRKWNGRLRSPEYAQEYKVCKIHSCGKCYFKNNSIYIGRVLEGEPIGLKEDENGDWEVYYGPILLGYLDKKCEFVRPKKH